MTPQTAKLTLRAMTRGAYDLQRLRIQMGQRICANFRAKLGLAPSDKEDDDAEAQKLLDLLRADYRRLTDAIIARNAANDDAGARCPACGRAKPKRRQRAEIDLSPEEFSAEGMITEYTELEMMKGYEDLLAVEEEHFARLQGLLPQFPIYTTFLRDITGIGPAMAAVLISEIDITKCRYPSSLWKYAGLDLGPDGRGRSRRREHLIKRKYIDANGQEQTRDSVTYSPFLKTKLMGVLAGLFLRTGNKEYRKLYDDYKHRVSTDPARAHWNKGHRHEAAKRYMIKLFLRDLYNAWRPLEALPVEPPYHEAKLGLHHRPAAE